MLPQEPLAWPRPLDDSDHWLSVEGIREGTEGGFATGSFNARRNKLDIRTRNVTAFAMDARRVPIQWARIVILGIDGTNSELRRRDFDVYHFQMNEYGQWIVLEP